MVSTGDHSATGMVIAELDKAKLQLVGFICTHRQSFRLSINQIQELLRVLEHELPLLHAMYVTDSAQAKSYWDCYQYIKKRFEKLYMAGKAKGSINLIMAHWLALYCLLRRTHLDSTEIRQVFDLLHQYVISFSHKGILTD